MIRFNNDYNQSAHPRIMEAITSLGTTSFAGYGLDDVCVQAAQTVRDVVEAPDAAVHFMVGGTQANATVITSLLEAYEGVISADDGHISAHETGAIEARGHKVLAEPSPDGKLSTAIIERVARDFEESGVQEHIVEPRLVFVSFPNEFGALYSKAELEAISTTCHAHGLLLFVDGARLGYGLGSPDNDVDIRDIARLTDVFTIGGTKCGALFGEAVVFPDPVLGRRFRSYMKQGGGLLAKGWLLGAQFQALLEDGLYFAITRKATEQALRIRDAFAAAGIPAHIDSPTNQQFIELTLEQAERLARDFVFDDEGFGQQGRVCVRFCTSWATADEEVDALVSAIEGL